MTNSHTDFQPSIDPITREIIGAALASAAEEMAVGLYRTARSTIVRDALDFSTSLCNVSGEQIAQGTTIPLHLGAVPYALETMFAKYGDDICPGDVLILNDPFQGGMHIPDIFVVKPIFDGDRRVAFAVATAHHLDLGGRVPGSSACDNTEIFQDGLRIPWLKLYDKGTLRQPILDIIRAMNSLDSPIPLPDVLPVTWSARACWSAMSKAPGLARLPAVKKMRPPSMPS